MEQREPYKVNLVDELDEVPSELFVHIGGLSQRVIVVTTGYPEREVVRLGITADGQVTVYGGRKVTVYWEGRAHIDHYLVPGDTVVVLPREVSDGRRISDLLG